MRQIAYLLVILVSISFQLSAQDDINTEELIIYNDSIQLPGILSFQPGTDKQPLAIFIQGSGNPDRNGNQLGMNIKANYIKQLAESLYGNGIAMFRFDKRNVPTVNHKFILSDYRFDHLVDDARTIIRHFKADERFGPLIVIGHSQGSLVGMLSADAGTDRFISLAGLSKPADEAIVWQISKQNESLSKVAEAHFNELRETDSIKQMNPFLAPIFAPVNRPFLKNYIQYDPRKEIGALSIPVLIINGDKDIQVTPEDAELLHRAKEDSEIKIIPGMNHVLKHIENDDDNMKSYYSEDFPVSEQLIEIITAFIKS